MNIIPNNFDFDANIQATKAYMLQPAKEPKADANIPLEERSESFDAKELNEVYFELSQNEDSSATLKKSADKRVNALQVLTLIKDIKSTDKTLYDVEAVLAPNSEEINRKLLEIATSVFEGFKTKFDRKASKLEKKISNFIANYCFWTKLFKVTQKYNVIKQLIQTTETETEIVQKALQKKLSFGTIKTTSNQTPLSKENSIYPLSEKTQENRSQPTQEERRAMFIEENFPPLVRDKPLSNYSVRNRTKVFKEDTPFLKRNKKFIEMCDAALIYKKPVKTDSISKQNS